MRILSLKTLKAFWKLHPQSETGLRYWYGKIESKEYSNPQEVIRDFKGADFIGNERIVFNIALNKFRLIASFNYEYQLCYVKFIGTYKEYDKVIANEVPFNE
ncbi:type II toxin-antitoxin system HigB family toxin [Arcicella sp. LKC2W]|uniref:type II toxin-antitoxin system HigB family toxin n=1 Tax=Arcicella sp. LKC2W TaxID=2984198 RepID=UPI002B20495F|nr:type II toxin-antitoxin system HigB family toxin [Arcicella sp. LKC2W]MEA5458167.1 type II toxin-antitoxin system HigB family toxin [Arcicella sp. LKC2W]